MPKVIFKLSMPNCNSWNGKWTGADKNYTITKSLTGKKLQELGITETKSNSWYYRWDDGWGASVSCRVVKMGEKIPKSDGFNGYDWMVDSIMDYGKIMADLEIEEYLKNEHQRIQTT